MSPGVCLQIRGLQNERLLGSIAEIPPGKPRGTRRGCEVRGGGIHSRARVLRHTAASAGPLCSLWRCGRLARGESPLLGREAMRAGRSPTAGLGAGQRLSQENQVRQAELTFG